MRLRSLVGVMLAVVCAQATAACAEQDWKSVLRGSAQTIVEYARQHHCDLNQGLDNGASSAMVYAIQSGRPTAVAALLAAGADVNADVYDGKTPLFYAAEARNAPAAKLLLEHGADVNVSTRFSQMSLLMAAVLSGVPQMVADLIKHGASLEDRDKYDQSARDYVAKLPKAQRPAMLRALGRA